MPQIHMASNIQTPVLSSIFLTPVTDKEIYNIIISLQNNKSYGFNGINTKMVKTVPFIHLLPPCIYYLSFGFEGQFPK